MKRRNWIKTAALVGGGLGMLSAWRGMALPSDSSHGYINLSNNEKQWLPSPKAKKAMIDAVPYTYEYPAVPYKKLRISLGNPAQMQALQSGLKLVLAAS